MTNNNIYEQLQQEHSQIRELLNQIEKASKEDRHDLLFQLEQILIPHIRAEERTMYALVRKRAMQEHKEEDIALANEAYEEHRGANITLEELKSIDPTSSDWEEKFKVLKDTLNHHIRSEEDEFFDVCKDNLTQGEQDHLLASYLQNKKKFEVDRVPKERKAV